MTKPSSVQPAISHQPMIRAREICKKWGGVVAIDQLNLDLYNGEIHALIGTNGAGKSTFINLLSGEFPQTSGNLYFEEEDISRWSQPKRARAGMGRTYQRTTIFNELTVFENCRLAAGSKYQKPWKFWQDAKDCEFSTQIAFDVLQKVGLEAKAQSLASHLAHGQKRQLEIAMCIATFPKILLLDEPLAGMGIEEAERILSLLESLKNHHAILLVEHDMDAVFRIADRVSVMVNGKLLASGMPDDIRQDARVIHAYLGQGETS